MNASKRSKSADCRKCDLSWGSCSTRPLMVGLFVVSGCGKHYAPDLVLIPIGPRLTGYWPLLILQVGWLLGYAGRTVTCLLSRLRPAPRGRAVAGRRI